MSRYWSAFVHDLHPYIPGEQPKGADLVKLNTNENPYGPSPRVLEAIRLATSDRLRLYPDATSDSLTQTIAAYCKVDNNNVFVGNGSDEVLAHIFNAFFKHDTALLFPDITYSFYPVYCGMYQIDYETVPLTDAFEIKVENYFKPNAGIIFPNPNAPTGRLLALSEIEALLQHNTESVVVIDEAYIDFGGESAVALTQHYPNLLVVQTLSKSRSLAGIRVGYAIGHEDLIEALIRVKDSFNSYPLDLLAQVAAEAAIQDQRYFAETTKKVITSREQLVIDMQDLGFEVIPSAANFIFCRHPQVDATVIAKHLRDEGVIVRHFNKDRIAQFLRISVGTPSENQRLMTALDSLL